MAAALDAIVTGKLRKFYPELALELLQSQFPLLQSFFS
jgi:hypothetical protein